jgi:hypothetical protein
VGFFATRRYIGSMPSNVVTFRPRGVTAIFGL